MNVVPSSVSAAVPIAAESASLRITSAEAVVVCLLRSAAIRKPIFAARLAVAAGTLLAGGTVVLPGHFTAEGFAAAVTAHRPTSAFLVPAHLQRLFVPDAPPLPDLSSFRLVAHAGAPCPTRLKERALDAFPEGSVWEFYGSTEAQFTVCSSDDWRARPGTVGRARAGRRLSVDEDGTIWCDTPRHARFVYWDDPDKTAMAWRGDACTVGDLGRLDAGGNVVITGRLKDIIIRKGENISAKEIEDVLYTHPKVGDVAVIGVPDRERGEMVVAVVQSAPGEGELTFDEMVALCRDSGLMTQKIPERLEVVEALPRNETLNKILKYKLREQYG